MPRLAFAPEDQPAIPLVALTKAGLDGWLAGQDSRVRTWAEATGFDAGAGRVMAVPDASGRIVRAVAGLGTPKDAAPGDDLLTQNLPMIHAVGRASDRAPRLLDMSWGSTGPKLTLVGKGVCFDTGGLDLKGAANMLLMKKDMGGAATVMGLAQMIMALKPAPAAAGDRAGGGECGLGPGDAAARHPDLAQGADGRGQRYRRRGALDPRRCADAGGRGGA
jgi:hypothetical protein